MEEETKKQQEIEKSSHLRKPSPSHGVRSPVVSPTRGISSPPRPGSASSDEHEVQKKMRLSTDSDETGYASGTRRSRADIRPPVPSRKPDVPRPAYSEPNLAKAVSNTPAGLLWKRRQNDILTDISNTDKFHDSKNRTQLSSSSSHVDGKSDSNDTLDNSVFSNSNGSLSEDLSITSAYHSRKPYFPSDNSRFSQGRSASTEILNSRSSNDSGRSRSHESRVQEEGSDSEMNVDKGGSVTKRPRQDRSVTHPGKRLSKEEIQAAIDRADTYLRSTSTSSDESESKDKRLSGEQMIVSDITSNSSGIKEVVPTHNMSQSDSKVHTEEHKDSDLKSWALYRKQRYSRTSDYLDDKVGDISKLGSISDTSVSGFRKSSMENLSKPAETNKANDPFAAISGSSVLMNRRSAPPVQQKPPSPRSTLPQPDTSSNIASETSLNFQTEQRDSGSKFIEKDADIEPIDSSEHSKTAVSGVTSNARPIPVPRRTAPPPPSEPPPPPPANSHSPPASLAPPSKPPPPVPESEVAEEIMEEEMVTKINQSEALSSIPPVPGLDIQMRDKAHFLSLDEPEETSDSEPQPSLDRAG